MHRILSAVVALSCIGTLTAAQRRSSEPSAEVGTLVGVTILSQTGFPSVTHIGIPGDGIQASPTLYATFFATPSLMVEPQISFTHISGGGSTLSAFGFAGQFGYLFTPTTSGSPYVAVNVAYQTISDGTSINGEGVGGVLGYRFKVKNSLAIRFDARYRRWFSDFKDLNEIGFGLGLGATF